MKSPIVRSWVLGMEAVLLLALGACGGGGGGADDNGGGQNPPPVGVAAPVITTQPLDASASQGATATFTVIATGESLAYQWKKNGAAISAATAASYTTPAVSASDDQASFTVTVTNSGGSVTSNAARLTVSAGAGPLILDQPASVAIEAGSAATFSVIATGSELHYQWYGRSEDSFQISGATNATLNLADFPSLSVYSGLQFYVVVSNDFGSVTSDVATLTYTQTPVDPPTASDCPGPTCNVRVAGASGQFPQPASPLAITPEMGAATAVTFRGWRVATGGAVDRSDQSWEVQMAPGVSAVVTMPWGAFLEDLDLQLTPVTAIGDLPLAGLTGALSIATGVEDELGSAASEQAYTVTFVLSDDAATAAVGASQTLFVADADGGNFHLLPVMSADASLTRITVQLDHLGIIGLADASDAERQAVAAHWPATVAAQMEAAQALPSLAARQSALATANARVTIQRARAATVRLLADQGDDFHAQQVDTQIAYYNDVVVPAVAAGYADHAQILPAIQTLLTFERGIQLSGLQTDSTLGPLSDRVIPTITDLLSILADDVKNACVSDGGGFDAVQNILSIMRQLQLFGLDAKADELKSALDACFRFRIELKHDWSDDSSSHSIPGPGYHDDVTLSEHGNQQGSGVLQGDAIAFLTTVTGGRPEGPLGLSLSYSYSYLWDAYRPQYVGDPVYAVVPVLDHVQTTCAATQDEVLGARMKQFGLVRYAGGKRAVRMYFINWGPGRIRCDTSASRDITNGAENIHSGGSSEETRDYIALRDNLLPFSQIQAVPGELETWAIDLKPSGDGFTWSGQATRSENGDDREESFEVTLYNGL